MKNECFDQDFLECCGFKSYGDYVQSMAAVAEKKTCLVLEREPSDGWINNYNPQLLKVWNANMDIQYVLDPYSCIMYIVSYITKAERELSEVMNLAKDEILSNEEDSRKRLKQLAQVYLKNHEMSVQEAVYRVCSLGLKDCSRDVVFILTDKNATQMSLPFRARR